jgi:hypothetical protein
VTLTFFLHLFLLTFASSKRSGPAVEKNKITGTVIEKMGKATSRIPTVTVIDSKAQSSSWRYHKSKENLILMYHPAYIY